MCCRRFSTLTTVMVVLGTTIHEFVGSRLALVDGRTKSDHDELESLVSRSARP